MAEFENPGVASRPRSETGADLGKEPSQRLSILDLPLRQPPRVQIAPTGQGNELLGKRPQLLGLGLGGDHSPVLEETGRHVIQHGALVTRGTGELAAFGAVSHYNPSPPAVVGCTTGGTPGRVTRSSPSVSSNAMPKLSPSRCSSSAISLSAFSPTFLTLSRSSSVNSTRSLSVRMLEFLSELSERTVRPKSSMGRARRWRRLAEPPTAPAAPASRMVGTLPKSTKYWKWTCARAAA